MCSNENECIISVQDSYEYTMQLNIIKPLPRVNTLKIQYNNKITHIIIPHFSITVNELKNIIVTKYNCEIDNIELYFGYTNIRDNKTLLEYNINYKSIINVYNNNNEDIIINIF